MNIDTENQELLKRILRAIELATKHHDFALYFVQCQLLADQDKYINYLKEQCNEMGVELLKVDLSRKIIKNPREEILNELNEKFPNGKPDKLTIAITGLEASILTDANEESPAVLQILNMGREHYDRDLPYPSMFWLPRYAIIKIASVAPDFWAWRGGGVNKLVSSEEAKRQAINEAFRLREPTNWDEGIYQIILFERLIEGHPVSEPTYWDEAEYQTFLERKSEYRKLQYRLGAAYYSLEKYPRAHQCYRRALEIGESLSDLAQQGKELNALGRVCLAMGKDKLQESLDYFNEYLAFSEKVGDEKYQGVALGNIGLVYHEMKQNERAIEYLKRARTINKKIRNPSGESDNLGNLGLAYQDIGDFKNAIKYHFNALKVSKKIEDLKREIKDLSNLGVAFSLQGNIMDAIGYFQQALELSQKSGDLPGERDLLINIAHCFQKLGDLDVAQDYYTRAKDTCRKMGDAPRECDVLIYLAELSHEFKETKKEIELYEKALDLSRKLRAEEKELNCLRKLIQLHHRQWEPDKAKKYINDACKLLDINLKGKPINVWLTDDSDRQPESLANNREYTLCLNIGKPGIGYPPPYQTDFIFDLVSGEEVSNKPIKPVVKPTTALEEEEEEQIPQPTPETYDVEEKTITVTESLGSKTVSHIDETQLIGLTPDQQPRQETSELIHEELGKEVVEVSVCLQSSDFEFDKNEKRLSVSREKDSETIYFGITPRRIGKQSIIIEGVANDIPWDLTIYDIEVEEAVAPKISETPESVKIKEPGIDWEGVNLRGVDLSGANLSKANLREANLLHANLRGADLTEAKLVRTDLRWADLREANLFNANMIDARLENADFSGANMINTNLESAKFNEGSNFTGARINHATKKTLPKSSIVSKWDPVVKTYIKLIYYPINDFGPVSMEGGYH